MIGKSCRIGLAMALVTSALAVRAWARSGEPVSGNLDLKPGQNWVALWGAPEVNQLARVLGHALAAGDRPESATRVTLYEDGVYPRVKIRMWLAGGDVPEWRYADGSRSAEQAELPLQQGFLIELPTDAAAVALPLTLRPPENSEPRKLAPNGAYNVTGLWSGQPLALGRCGLREAGFSASEFNPEHSDEVRILQPGVGDRGSPQARILMDPTDGRFKFWTGGPPGASAEEYPLQPGQAFFVYTRCSKTALQWQIPAASPGGSTEHR